MSIFHDILVLALNETSTVSLLIDTGSSNTWVGAQILENPYVPSSSSHLTGLVVSSTNRILSVELTYFALDYSRSRMGAVFSPDLSTQTRFRWETAYRSISSLSALLLLQLDSGVSMESSGD